MKRILITMLMFFLLWNTERLPASPTESVKPVNEKTIDTRGGSFSAQDSVIIRKSKKYGVNPNLIRAVLKAELTNLDRSRYMDESSLEWIVEQITKVLHHVLKKTTFLPLAGEHYGTGTFELPKKLDKDTRKFTKQVIKEFRRLEKISPWQGR